MDFQNLSLLVYLTILTAINGVDAKIVINRLQKDESIYQGSFQFAENLISNLNNAAKELKSGLIKFFSSPDIPIQSHQNVTKSRVKRQVQRSIAIQCCGDQACSEGALAEYKLYKGREVPVYPVQEAEIVSEMQYTRRMKKRRKKKKGSPTDLSQLHAFGVFTDAGIHISCAGCPSGWPDMLTVYPEMEIGIPVTCSNCPSNWPGALNLLGVGGDPSWAQSDPNTRMAGNNFMAFDAGSNFGGGGLAPAPPASNVPDADIGGGADYNNNYDEYSDDTSPRESRAGNYRLVTSSKPFLTLNNTAFVSASATDQAADEGEEEGDYNEEEE
ncbi:uncharacterized protein LOC132196990 [Neocloeon triangulifer]|uniref:uncharacterized protein LOC132196990 n=1 Tax=Neocloeon triangulifer TaxID=2078957 RepID=UPI00286EE2EA|nr:uncharacterized protein LOC132196990 [Neocloeon triangulifer]